MKRSSSKQEHFYDYGTQLNAEAEDYMGDPYCPCEVGWLEGRFLPDYCFFDIRRPKGLLDDVLCYIERRAYFDQPELNLFSALATTATLMAGKVSTPNGDVLSILAMGLAPSSAGKDAGVSSPRELLQDLGMASHLLGKLGSKQALEKSMSENAVRLMTQDEAGPALLSAGKCQFASQVAPAITEMWNGKHYIGSAAIGRPTWSCERPHLSAYITGTPDHVHNASNDGQVADGNLPRWLLATGERKDPRDKFEPDEDIEADQALCAKVKSWTIDHEVMEESVFATMNRAKMGPPRAKLTLQAQELLELHDLQYSDYAGQVEQHGELYTKANQIVARVATIHAAGRADHPKNAEVDLEDVQFAIEVIGASMRNYRGFIKGMNRTEQTKLLEKVLGIIKKGGRNGIGHSDLVRTISAIPAKQRNELITTLIEAKLIVAEKVGQGLHYVTSSPNVEL